MSNSDEEDRGRSVLLPDVNDTEYARLTDCLQHAKENAVTSEEFSRIEDLLSYIHRESDHRDS